MTAPPLHRGQTQLIEQAARDCTAHLADDSRDRWPLGICILIWAAVLVPVWAGIVALALEVWQHVR